MMCSSYFINIFWFLCLCQLALGVLLLVASIRVTEITNGQFIGAIYTACIAIFAALLGFAVPFPWLKQPSVFTWFHMANFGTLICSVIGAAICNQTVIALDELSSCAYYALGESSCPLGDNDLACIGESSTFRYADNCASYGSSVTPNTCYCTYFGANFVYQCAYYHNIPSCEDLLYRYPGLIYICFGFAIGVLIVSVMLLLFFRSLQKFEVHAVTLPAGEGGNGSIVRTPEVMILAADSAPVGVVATATINQKDPIRGQLLQAEALPIVSSTEDGKGQQDQSSNSNNSNDRQTNTALELQMVEII